uniref:Steroid 21-hydroxylase n=1 Tax=Petromyzon marinus TaxID=7757 RepID=A0AAJ7TC05_PETMA|nr:steroid 21-hydroxylase-like [Petromyzon marinus]
MELTWGALLLLLFLLLVLLVLLLNSGGRGGSRRRSLRVPGPRGVPLLGNVAELFRTDRHRHLAKLARRYGPVYSLRLGAHEMVVLNSAEVLREALIKKSADFAGRPQTYTGCAISFGGRDLSLGDFTPAWRLQSRMARAGLRDRSADTTHAVIAGEGACLCHVLRGHGGRPVDPMPILSVHTSNIVCALSFGVRYAEQDPEFRKLRESLDELVHLWGSSTIMARDHLPWLRKFPSATWTRFLEAVERRDHVVRGHLEAHKKGGARAGTEDITTSMLRFLKQEGRGEGEGEVERKEVAGDNEEEEAEQVEHGSLTEQHLHMVLVDLLVGGSETTAITLVWAIAFLMHDPQLQERLHAELLRAVGRARAPLYADRFATPLLRATINEVLRTRPVAPLGIPHLTTRDTSVGGYQLPRGTTVIPNLWAAQHDPDKWSNPERFQPDVASAGDDDVPLTSPGDDDVPLTSPGDDDVPLTSPRRCSTHLTWRRRCSTHLTWRRRCSPRRGSDASSSSKRERHLHRDPSAERRPVGSLLPFGAGPRACLGASLARAELYILLALLIRDFRFEAEGGPGGDLPDLDGELTVILKPKPFHMRFLERP